MNEIQTNKRIRELQTVLLDAYTIGNLNRISNVLIDLYRNKKYSALQRIAEVINDLVDVEIGPKGKGFSKLMMLYHPDRAGFHINNVNRMTEQNNLDALISYSHILRLDKIEELSASLIDYEDIDYVPVYDWDIDELESEGFSIIDYAGNLRSKGSKTRRNSKGYNFYDAFKLRELGRTNVEYPVVYLGDIEEFELASSGINDLEGIQFCINARTIDISDNNITDLSLLSGLANLEELNLSGNRIEYIDGIDNLKNLRFIQLSGNNIEDISPLFALDNLEYADLAGNRIDIDQINHLIECGIAVNF